MNIEKLYVLANVVVGRMETKQKKWVFWGTIFTQNFNKIFVYKF